MIGLYLEGQEEHSYETGQSVNVRHLPMDDPRELIKKAVERGLVTYAALSRASGKNSAYFQQYVTRGVPRELDEDVRASVAPLLQVEPQALRDPTRAAKAPSTALASPNLGPSLLPLPPPNLRPGPPLPEDPVGTRARDFPIFGTAAGANGDGAFVLSAGEVVDWRTRPASLASNRRAFGLYVEGDSMHPALPHGELIVVDPVRKAAAGDLVVIVIVKKVDDNGHEQEAFVKELVRATADKYLCRQYNPPKQLEFERRQVAQLYRVLTRAEMMGV